MESDSPQTREYPGDFQKPFWSKVIIPLGVPLVYGSYEPIVSSVPLRLTLVVKIEFGLFMFILKLIGNSIN